ncbi:OmpA family protein [Kaistia dalseonensis]|uniref:Outer membrane protein OmpA-like peptidoglycan-associated protein n=1 Tax=Kaistia dalseonensis TaxID=410840 RepID=A0ABU0H3R7_9HYPH|nr:OmpA family protein [Kaistia dalseonensis]MCX5493561.1 OmpA family protein [Kaistia dalseonensis]MDQ0436121.1 outer membrane protein OmpA-like peptidoglycan-associated protein [Kaistia dalseonensis]
MSAWRLWVTPGLVIVTVLAAIAIWMSIGRIEADIGQRVDAELATDGQDWASAEVSGRTVTVMGTAPTVIAQRLAVESADRVWGVSLVLDGSGIIPLQPAYSWTATRSEKEIRLTGYVPGEDERLAVLSAAKRYFPGFTLQDQMQDARGQPVNFLGLTDFALARLAELGDGSVVLNGPSLSIDGTAIDEPRFAAAARALSGPLPANAAIRSVRILPPRKESFVWHVDFNGKTIRIEGFVPSELVRRDIALAIQTALPGISIDDQTELASGAPGGFDSAAIFAVYQLAHLTEGQIAIDGKVLSFKGSARTVADYETTLAEIGARRDKHSVGVAIGSIDVVPASVDPYVWRADRSGTVVVLSGYMPTPVARDEVLKATAELFPGMMVTDRLRIADGDPKMDWIGAVEYSLRQLALLGKGSVSLTGRSYDIVGEAISTTAYAELVDALKKTLPASMELRRKAVAPAAISPFIFAAGRLPDALSFSGYVPTDEAAKQIVALARPKFGQVRIDMQLLLAGGAPDGFVDAVGTALQAISRLDGGRFELVDTKLSLSGVAVSDGARQAIESTVQSSLPDGFEFSPSLMVAVGGDPLAAGECQTALRTEMERDMVQFESGTATILPDSYGLLDRLAAIVQRCPAATVEVGAHTDSGGGTRKNQALSEARAKAVVDRLVEDGVRQERLRPIGYGQSRPIASNSNAAGRAQNRRIEFNVVGQ